MRLPGLKRALLLQLWLQNLNTGASFVNRSQLDSEKPVQHVTLIARHGERTPTYDTYPTDPLNKSEIWPEGIYQLTTNGKNDLYKVGIWLRERYDNLLGDFYVPEELRAQSTVTDRSIMSALLILAGLFPPKGHQIWNPDLLWQPIPVVPLKEAVVTLYDHIQECDRFNEEYKLMIESDEYKQLLVKHQDVIKSVQTHTGMTSELNEFNYLMFVLDYMQSQIKANLTIPEWAQNIYPEPWTTAAQNYFHLATFNDKMKRLFVGAQLKEIREQMIATVAGQSKKKMTLHVGHEDIVVGFLDTFKIFNGLEPPTSSVLAFELRKDIREGNYFVAIYFKNTSTDTYWMTLPGCETVCPLKKFLSISSPYTQTRSQAEECTLQSSATHLKGAGALITLIIVAVKVACIN